MAFEQNTAQMPWLSTQRRIRCETPSMNVVALYSMNILVDIRLDFTIYLIKDFGLKLDKWVDGTCFSMAVQQGLVMTWEAL